MSEWHPEDIVMLVLMILVFSWIPIGAICILISTCAGVK
jgi:hypothetical protein